MATPSEILQRALSFSPADLEQARRERVGRLQNQAFGNAEFESFAAADMQFPLGRESLDADRASIEQSLNSFNQNWSGMYSRPNVSLNKNMQPIPLPFRIEDGSLRRTDRVYLNGLGGEAFDWGGTDNSTINHEFRHRSDYVNPTENTPSVNDQSAHRDIYALSLLEADPKDFKEGFADLAWINGIDAYGIGEPEATRQSMQWLLDNKPRLLNRIAESAFNQGISVPNIKNPTLEDQRKHYNELYESKLDNLLKHYGKLINVND